MTGTTTSRRFLTRIVGPLVVLAVAGGVGHLQARGKHSRFLQATRSVSDAERARLEAAPAMSAANATWAFGSVDAVRAMARTEIDRLGETATPAHARVFLRFAIIDTNPDGQAALLAQACLADPNLCDHVSEWALREAHARFVAPGNTLPVSMLEGHPRVHGARP